MHMSISPPPFPVSVVCSNYSSACICESMQKFSQQDISNCVVAQLKNAWIFIHYIAKH